jgi:hypothetical protein
LTEIGKAESHHGAQNNRVNQREFFDAILSYKDHSGAIIALIRIKSFENGFEFSAQRAVGVEVALRA